jgi:carbon monoxide dehydrogenase subunit G
MPQQLHSQWIRMKIDERILIEAPIDAVWAFVRNPHTVAPCIPGCKAVDPILDKQYRSTIGVALGPIKAHFKLVVEITEELPSNRLVCVTRGEEGGKASIITATTEVKFAAQEGGRTEINCASEVSIVGRLGKFGLGIMNKRATQLAGEFAATVQQRMQSADA